LLRKAVSLLMLVLLLLSSQPLVFAAKFSLGDTVEVINTGASGLVVRDAPAGNSIGKKYDGSRGMVLAGPQSASLGGVVYTWWKVRWGDDALEGWSAEGYPGGVDYLKKVSVSPSTKFSIGDFVKVYNTGGSLVVRTDPPALSYKDSEVDGTFGKVEGGPFYGVAAGTPGFYHFWKVNYGSVVGWSAENWLMKATPSDLTVEDIWIDPASFNPGSTVTIYWRIKNIGASAAISDQGLLIKAYFDGALYHQEGIEGLGAGYSYTSQRSYTWPSDTNSHTIRVEVDPSNYIIESNENNNIRSESFQATAPPPFDFTVGVSPSSGSVQQGGSVSATVTVTLTSGSTQTVSLTTSGLPSGAYATFNPSSGYPTFTSTVTISTSTTTPTGTFYITITGSGGGLTRTATYTLTVTPLLVPDFSISASPTSLTIQQGSSGSSAITITSINGFNQPVQLSVSGAPSGVTATLSPSQVTPPAGGSTTSTLTVSVGTSATTGSYPLTVTGTSGALTHSAYVSLEITALPPNYPPTCVIKLQKDGVEISEIDVGEFFDIYVGGSTDDTGIKQVRFSSDDHQDNHPTGEWTDWYDWETSSGDWSASTKIKRWSFTTPGYKEVWAEVKDDIDQTDERLARIYVPGSQPPSCVVELRKDGVKIDDVDAGQFFDVYVGDSTDDAAIVQVMFSSDDSQDGVPTGEWTDWYDWNQNSGDWSALDKTMKWSFATGGKKEVWAMIMDSDGNVVWNHSNIFAHPGYAILVGGGAGFWKLGLAIDFNANNAYRVLRNLGFDDEHIYYLNRRLWDVDGDGDYETDAYPSLDNFKGAIEWAKERVNEKTQFILYLIGHGYNDPSTTGTFFLDETTTQGISPSDLNNLLSAFPEQMPTFIGIDACYSGVFITPEDGTISIPNRKRVIITSAHDDQEKSWFFDVVDLVAGNVIFYSDDFWRNLNNGLSLKDAFIKTGDAGHAWLDDNGDTVPNPPNSLKDDGKLAETMHIGTPGIENIPLKPFAVAELFSSAELRVYDSYGRITGLVEGEVKEEIPGSFYIPENNTVVIFDAIDTYCYEVVGTEAGTYGLGVVSIETGDIQTFNATEIPTASATVHHYTIYWVAVSQGEEGVTVQVDSNGDGIFEHTFTSDSELTQSEFLSQMAFYTFSIVWGAETFVISVESNSTVSTFAFSQSDKEISFNVTGEAGTVGFCNVTIPKALLYGEPWTVLIDGAPVPATITENATHSFLYFTYAHSTHLIQIMGTWVIAPPPPPTYSLTITTTVGGTTDPAPGTYSYTANSSVEVTAISNADYVFDHWELDTINVGSANPYTVLMDNNHTLKAVFAYSPPPPSLSASISPLSASILVGQSVTFTSTVSGGYTPYSYQWYLNGAPVAGATSNTWTFTPTASGIYYVHLKVTDSKANTAQSETARVSVATVPVGGYSVPIDRYIIAKPLMLYFASVAILAIAFAVVRRKTPRKPK